MTIFLPKRQSLLNGDKNGNRAVSVLCTSSINRHFIRALSRPRFSSTSVIPCCHHPPGCPEDHPLKPKPSAPPNMPWSRGHSRIQFYFFSVLFAVVSFQFFLTTSVASFSLSWYSAIMSFIVSAIEKPWRCASLTDPAISR